MLEALLMFWQPQPLTDCVVLEALMMLQPSLWADYVLLEALWHGDSHGCGQYLYGMSWQIVKFVTEVMINTPHPHTLIVKKEVRRQKCEKSNVRTICVFVTGEWQLSRDAVLFCSDKSILILTLKLQFNRTWIFFCCAVWHTCFVH